MIIARIDGGLGNQMFQYAYGRYLAERHQTELLLDTSSYDTGPQHGYLLDRFQIRAQQMTEQARKRIPNRHQPREDRRPAWRDWLQRLSGSMLRRIKERPFGFAERYLAAADNSYLVGYWQSEKFFPGLRAQLLNELTLCQPLSLPSQQVARHISSCESLALHIRRGDYVTDAAAAQIYARLELDYYRRAVEAFAATARAPELFVFSNDIAWCREKLHFPFPTHYVDHNNRDTAHEDLVLMSQAAGCVIANSTFSWWSAWLNQRPGKRIFAPREWFQPGTLDGSSVLCADWQQISAITGRVSTAA